MEILVRGAQNPRTAIYCVCNPLGGEACQYRLCGGRPAHLGTVADALCASIVRSAMPLLTFSMRFFSACMESASTVAA